MPILVITTNMESKPLSQNALLTSSSHVTLIFSLILLAVFGVIISGLFNVFAPCAIPLLAIAVVFPLRDLASWVEDTRSQYSTTPYPALQREVENLAQELGLTFIPKIEQTQSSVGIFTVGGLRRSLIVGDKNVLDWLLAHLMSGDTQRATEARVILYHELQHLSQKDLRRLGFARQLLAVILKWVIWAFLFALGFFLLLAIIGLPLMRAFSDPTFVQKLGGDDPLAWSMASSMFPSSQEVADLLNKTPAIPIWPFVLATATGFTPIFLSTILMWLVLLRRMFRLREYYADAACVQRFGVEAVSRALSNLSIQMAYPSISETLIVKSSSAKNIWAFLRARRGDFAGGWAHAIRAHDSLSARLTALDQPVLAVFEPKSTGITIGFAVLLVEFLLVSSFILFVTGQWPAHITTLVFFMAFSIAVRPLAAETSLSLGQLNKRVAKSMIIATLIANIYNLLNYGLAWALMTLAPVQTMRFLEIAISPFTGLFHQFLTDDFVASLQTVVSGSIITILAGIGISWIAVFLDLKIMRNIHLRIIAPTITRRLGWLLTLAIGSWLSLVLCLISAIAMSDSEKFTDPLTIISGLSALVFSAWLAASFSRGPKTQHK